MNNFKKIVALLLMLKVELLYANSTQRDSLFSNLNFSTYFETYYTYDFDNNNEKIRGIVNHHKNNELAINMALIRANYASDYIRTNLGIMIGSYADKNYSGLDASYKYIYESNVGVKLSKNQNIWFDIGIMPSHIGIETAIGIDNWTLTRSLQAEASPYYEAGARLSYTSKNEKLYASILVLNGWQVITKPSNFPLSLGTQLQYKPTKRLLINSSTYLGNNNSSISNFVRPRYFHNFYTQIQISNKFSTIIGLDIGAEEIWNKVNSFNIWYAPIILGKYAFNNKHSISCRAEYLDDQQKNIFPTNSLYGFVGFGYSINYDLRLNKYSMFRVEAKMFNTEDPLFNDGQISRNSNKAINTSFIFYID